MTSTSAMRLGRASGAASSSENLVASGLDDQGRQAGQVGESGLTRSRAASCPACSRRLGSRSSRLSSGSLPLGFHGRPGEGEIGIR